MILVTIVLLGLSSCTKEDNPVPLPEVPKSYTLGDILGMWQVDQVEGLETGDTTFRVKISHDEKIERTYRLNGQNWEKTPSYHTGEIGVTGDTIYVLWDEYKDDTKEYFYRLDELKIESVDNKKMVLSGTRYTSEDKKYPNIRIYLTNIEPDYTAAYLKNMLSESTWMLDRTDWQIHNVWEIVIENFDKNGLIKLSTLDPKQADNELAARGASFQAYFTDGAITINDITRKVMYIDDSEVVYQVKDKGESHILKYIRVDKQENDTLVGRWVQKYTLNMEGMSAFEFYADHTFAYFQSEDNGKTWTKRENAISKWSSLGDYIQLKYGPSDQEEDLTYEAWYAYYPSAYDDDEYDLLLYLQTRTDVKYIQLKKEENK